MQAQQTFATVELSRRSVFPGEPFQLKVTTYTSTYYLSPISFSDFRVPNAFTVSFSRTLSGVTKVNGQQYATLQFFMQVYPLESGLLEIPSMELSFQSPPEGDYVGKEQMVKTDSRNITIKPIPSNVAVNPWFVAGRVLLSDSWDKKKQPYKVGDVLERKVTVKAFGTLPYYIPELDFNRKEGMEIYPKTAILEDKRNDEQAIGWKTQRVLYLLTKEGEITVPELVVNWFNPLTNKAIASKLSTKTIQVLPNENMGMLESIRDSLAVPNEGLGEEAVPEKKDMRKIAIKLGLVVLIIGFMFKLIPFLLKRIQRIKKNRINYRKTADWHYKQIFKNTDSTFQIINAINIWWDLARGAKHPVSVSEALKDNVAYNTWIKMQELNQKPEKKDVKLVVETLSKTLVHKSHQNDEFSINP